MLRASLSALGGLLIALTMGRPLGAQDRSLVELGASAVHFRDEGGSAFGPSVRWQLTRERGRSSSAVAAGAVTGSGGASGFLDVTGRRQQPLGAGFSAELGGELGTVLASAARSSGAHASSALATARLIRPLGAGGLWLRGSGSLSLRELDRLGGRGVGAGGWWRWPGVQVAATVAREWTAAQLFTEPNRGGYVGTVPVAYVEGALGLQAERDDATLSLTATVRRDPGAERLTESSFGGTVVFWQAPTRALFLSASSQLPDFVRGADAARSITFGIRLRDPSPATVHALRARPLVQVTGQGESRTLSVRAPTARRVEVMGDFTGWEPIELVGAGSVFSAVVAMQSGTRRLVVRLDGGAWQPAANTPAVDDDFGGRVGLLLVP